MIWKFMVDGGWLMAPILVTSVIAVALILERSFFWLVLRMNRDEALRSQLMSLEVPERAAASGDPLCQVLLAVARRPDDPSQAVSLADRIIAETKGPLPILNLMAGMSTSLGLLGTVVGVAQAFQELGGKAHMAQLIGPLSVALNTTILGLFVYLPALAGSSVSLMFTSRLALELEQAINSILGVVRARAEQGPERAAEPAPARADEAQAALIEAVPA